MKKFNNFLMIMLFCTVSFFARQDTISYKLKLQYFSFPNNFTTTIDEGSFLEGEKYIIPEHTLGGGFIMFNEFYDALEHSAFWLDDGAVDENIHLDITLGGLNTATGWPNLQFGFQLFLFMNIDVYRMPGMIPVWGNYNFNDGKYINFAIPKHSSFLTGMSLLGMHPDSLGFRYVLGAGFDITCIETINMVDSVKFRAEHLSKFGGGRGNLPTGVEIETFPDIPRNFSLEQNYPNPFNPATSIVYSLPEACYVEMKIFDITGAEVETLHRGYQEAGKYKVTYTAQNLSTGIYIYELRSGEIRLSKKMLYLK